MDFYVGVLGVCFSWRSQWEIFFHCREAWVCAYAVCAFALVRVVLAKVFYFFRGRVGGGAEAAKQPEKGTCTAM